MTAMGEFEAFWLAYHQKSLDRGYISVADLRAAWQASRIAALEEAAKECEKLHCRPEFEPEIQDRMLAAAAKQIRALKD